VAKGQLAPDDRAQREQREQDAQGANAQSEAEDFGPGSARDCRAPLLKVRSIVIEFDNLSRQRLQGVADELAARGELPEDVARLADRYDIARRSFVGLHQAPIVDVAQTLNKLIALGSGGRNHIGGYPQGFLDRLPL